MEPGWLPDYSPIGMHFGLKELREIPVWEGKEGAIARLAMNYPRADRAIYLASMPPSLLAKSPGPRPDGLDEPWSNVFGNGPCSGEFGEIAVFGENVLRRPGYGSENLDKYAESLLNAVLAVDLSDKDSVIDFLRSYGAFTQDYSLSSLTPSAVAVHATTLLPLEHEGTTEVEPLWLAARRIAKFRFVRELYGYVSGRKFSAIRSIAHAARSGGQGNGCWTVSFAPGWIPPAPMEGLCDENAFVTTLPFEPVSSHHYLLAAVLLLTELIQSVVRQGLAVILTPTIRGYDREKVPSTPEGRDYLKRFSRIPSTFHVDGEEITTPLFVPGYYVAKREQLLYMKLLDQALKPAARKFCQNRMCRQPFTPIHASQTYCTECRTHKQSELRRERRLRSRSRARKPKNDRSTV